MYNSGILTADLIANVQSEADITIPIGSDSWYRWINAVEQFVYTEIFDKFAVKTVDFSTKINLKDDISTVEGCAVPIFDDIIKVYADETELDRSGVISRLVFSDKPLYCDDLEGNIAVSGVDFAEKITVVYRIRPRLKESGDGSYINLPVEFADMAAARMRAEAYKIANEGNLSAVWMADYNTQLETLKVWAAMRNERYGE
ncbi:MAG: hypothetical protein E7638_06780 [Ruminococcaceae bacterium]|nr:hypothetical protein [Oscillospiraceae bacterium]